MVYQVIENYQILHRLAKEGNIAVVLADFTSERFIEEIRKLPEYNSLRSVIYLSNIIDHMTRAKRDKQKVREFNQAINQFEHKPVKNYYVFCHGRLKIRYNYKLRVETEPPIYMV